MHTKRGTSGMHTIFDSGLLEQALDLGDFLRDGSRGSSERDQTEISKPATDISALVDRSRQSIVANRQCTLRAWAACWVRRLTFCGGDLRVAVMSPWIAVGGGGRVGMHHMAAGRWGVWSRSFLAETGLVTLCNTHLNLLVITLDFPCDPATAGRHTAICTPALSWSSSVCGVLNNTTFTHIMVISPLHNTLQTINSSAPWTRSHSTRNGFQRRATRLDM